MANSQAAQSSGIRAIAANPSHKSIAIACGSPNNVHVLDLPTLSSKSILQGHTDTTFSVAWIDDRTLISGSRDGTMKYIFKPTWSVTDPQKQRIRDLRYLYNKPTTLSSDGVVTVWDMDTHIAVNRISLRYPLEAECMAGNERHGILAVGSQANISITDPRGDSPVHAFTSINEYSGVRPLDFTQHINTSGGGLGRVGGCDVRAHEYLRFDDDQSFHCTSPDWFDKENDLFRSPGVAFVNAIFTLSYSSQRGKLFTGGGPMQANLKGAYAGMWM